MENNLLVGIDNTADLIGYLDEVDDYSFKIVSKYLTQHSFDEVESRLLYDYQSGAGIGRVLRNVWIQYMDCRPSELIELYAGTTKKGELPHYENLIGMALVTFLSALAANIIATEYKEHRENILAMIRKSFSKSQEIIHKTTESVKEPFNKLARYFDGEV